MKNKFIEILLLIILIVTITITLYKKNDYNEITQGAYVSSIGIDYDIKTKEYTIYFYILNNFNLGTSQFAQGEATNLGYVTKGTGLTIPSAIQSIKLASNIRLETSHIKSMVLKDTFFNNNNTYDLVNYIKHSPDFYPSFIVYVTSDDIKNIYEVNNFSETSAYYTLLVNNQGINKPKLTTFIDFINDVLDDNYTTMYPIIKSKKDIIYDYNDEYTTLYIDGFGFITNNTQISFFKYDNLFGLTYFNPLKKGVLSYDYFDFLVYEFYYSELLKENHLNISIKIHGKVIQNRTNKESNELFKYLEKNIINDLNKLKETMDSYNIDVFNINHKSNNKNFKEIKLTYNIKII